MAEEAAPAGHGWPGPLRDRRVRRWAIGLIAGYAIYAFALGVVAPTVARSLVEETVGDLLGVDVSIERVSANPFTLRIEIAGIDVRERDGESLLSARSLWANIEFWQSITGVLHVSAIGLEGPEVQAVLSESGELNLLALAPEDDPDDIDSDAEEDAGDGLFPVRIDEIHVSEGSVSFYDRSQDHLFVESVVPIDLVIHDISTVSGETGRVRLDATSARGIRIQTEFETTLDPLTAHGDLSLEGIHFDVIGDYLGPSFPTRPTSGQIDVHSDFTIEAPETGLVISVERGELEAREWEAESDLAELSSIGLERFTIEGFRLALADRAVGIESITLEGPRMVAVLPGDGATEASAQEQPEASIAASEATGSSNGPRPEAGGGASQSGDDWRLDVNRFAITDGRVGIALPASRDSTIVSVSAIEFEALGISSTPEDTLEVALSLTLPDGAAGAEDATAAHAREANLEVRGTIGLRPPSAQLEIEAKDVALSPWSRVVGFAPGIRIDSGRLDLTSSIDATLPIGDAKPTGDVHTNVMLQDFALSKHTKGKSKPAPLVAFKRLDVDRMRIGASGESVALGTVRVDQPEITLTRDAQGELNLSSVMAPSAPVEKIEAALPAPTIDVRRVEIEDGRLNYRDATTDRPFHVDLTDIAGAAERETPTGDGTVGTFDFNALVSGSAPLRVTGNFPDAGGANVDVVLEGLTVVVLGPYFEQYIGSEAEQGKLNLKLHYELDGRKIVGQNRVRFDSLVFGKRTHSPDALKLPVPLAFKLMTDRKEQARFNLPIKGDLDDPGFSLRGLITTAFVKVIQQSLSSPLAVLQTAMPDLTSDQKTQLTFAPGSAELDEEQRARLIDVATYLASKPKNRVAIKGRVDRRRDQRALRELEDLAKEDEDEALRTLGRARARAIQDELVEVLGLDANRIFIRSLDLDGRADDGRVPVDIVLTDD